MTCFCLIPGTDNFNFVHEQDFESLWLWDVNRGN